MILSSIKNNFNIITFLILVFICHSLPGQTNYDIQTLKEKYPKTPVIISERYLKINLKVEPQPAIERTDYRELLVLSDKATFLADSREYFSGLYELKKFEAYSLVNEKGKTKKYPVEKYTRISELDDEFFFDDEYAFGFVFPAVCSGARLVTKSMSVTHDLHLPLVYFFGSRIPVENQQFTISCPKNVVIRYHLFGMDTSLVRFTKTEKKDEITYQWTFSGNKCYETDEYTPSFRYFTPHIIVHIAGYYQNGTFINVMSSMNDLIKWCQSKIGHVNTAEQPTEIKQLTDSVTRNAQSDYEKVRLIYAWVQKNIKYIAIEDGDNGYVPAEAENVLKRRYGDCKGKTSLLVAMLRSQGLKASFAWVGTRDLPYSYNDFPSIANSNHMIAVWWTETGNPVILDGTTRNHSLDDIPVFIQGKECLIAKDNGDYCVYSIPIAPPLANSVCDSLFIELHGDTLTGHGKAIFTGERKADLISLLEGKDTSKINSIVMKTLPKASNKFLITSAVYSDLSDNEKPLTISYTFRLPDYISKNKDFYYINPNIDRFLHDIDITADRALPFENEMTISHIFFCSIKLPGYFETGPLPENLAYSHPKFSFSQQYQSNKQEINLTTFINLNFHLLEGEDIKEYREMLSLLKRNYLKSIPFINKKL
jgi:hypothetical protein